MLSTGLVTVIDENGGQKLVDEIGFSRAFVDF